ncbi:hypothetical protein [Streptomyces ureilyticus]|uniref:hypothetical protein n=1 Tax=Streptomyces ureilyticus TaxID=1775131 RepID=UPI001F1C1673|nr:hypothetical protein [Streptomyces ureilyticus]
MPRGCAALADDLEASGQLTDPTWRKVFETVPRHPYVPEFWTLTGQGQRRVTSADPGRLDVVYTDDALATQLTDGVSLFRCHGRRVSTKTSEPLLRTLAVVAGGGPGEAVALVDCCPRARDDGGDGHRVPLTHHALDVEGAPSGGVESLLYSGSRQVLGRG